MRKRKAASQGPEAAKKQMTLYESLNQVPGTKQQKFEGYLTRYITESMRPYSTVEDPAFGELVHFLDPKLEMPSRRNLMRMIDEAANTSREEAKRFKFQRLSSSQLK